MAKGDDKAVLAVKGYGGTDKRKWELMIGTEDKFNRRSMSGSGARFRSEQRAYKAASDLAVHYLADGMDVILVSKSGKERTLSGA